MNRSKKMCLAVHFVTCGFTALCIQFKTLTSGAPSLGPLAISPESSTFAPVASLAQLVERLIRNEQVVGSSPMRGSNPGPKNARFDRVDLKDRYQTPRRGVLSYFGSKVAVF